MKLQPPDDGREGGVPELYQHPRRHAERRRIPLSSARTTKGPGRLGATSRATACAQQGWSPRVTSSSSTLRTTAHVTGQFVPAPVPALGFQIRPDNLQSRHAHSTEHQSPPEIGLAGLYSGSIWQEQGGHQWPRSHRYVIPITRRARGSSAKHSQRLEGKCKMPSQRQSRNFVTG